MGTDLNRWASRGKAAAGAVLIVLILAVPSFARSEPEPPAHADQTRAIALSSATAPAPAGEEAGCPSGHLRVAAEQIGTEPPRSCLLVKEGPFKASRAETSRVDSLLSRVATDVIAEAGRHADGLALRDAIVICWSIDDWKRLATQFKQRGNHSVGIARGFVRMPSNVINLSVQVCPRLSRVPYEDHRLGTGITATAISTLAHEAVHVAGIADEAVAECYALQLTEHVARQLGGDRAYASRMSELRANIHQEHWQGTDYDHPECRNNGRLDLGIDDAVWSYR